MWRNLGVRVAFWFLSFVYLTFSRNTKALTQTNNTHVGIYVLLVFHAFVNKYVCWRLSKQKWFILFHCCIVIWSGLESIIFCFVFLSFFLFCCLMAKNVLTVSEKEVLDRFCRAVAHSTLYESVCLNLLSAHRIRNSRLLIIHCCFFCFFHH